MGWNYSMMNGNWGAFSPLGSIVGVIVVIDLVLLGVWLWKKIGEK